MAEPLRPDGTAVRVGDIVVVSPGLTGRVEVLPPGSEGMRAAEDARAVLLAALAREGFSEQLTVRLIDPVEVPELASGTSRATSLGEPAITVEVPGPGAGLGQLILAADEDGALSWHLPDDIDPVDVPDRGGDRRTYTFVRAVAPVDPGASRGLIGAVGSKLLKVLVFPLIDPVLGKVGDHFVSRWEQHNRPVRLRQFTVGGHRESSAASVDWSSLSAGPALLFLHGTGSQSHTGFHGVSDEVLSTLHTRYGGRVFAYDHHTIATDPVANARSLVAQIPVDAGLRLDIVAHSRGGLVGRVLCELPGEIGLTTERMSVRTLVMVATPNAGTPLCDPAHVAKWLDRMTNLLQWVPDNGITDMLDVVLTVVKQVAVGAFRGLSGLMSMDPKGSFLERLNQPSAHSVAYRALASNYDPPKGSSLLRSARNVATDSVFGSAHNDLVVPTDGVFAANGAFGFPVGEVELFDAEVGVDHSGYWTQPRFAAAVDRWLVG
ncbi:Glutamate synthase [NADPH] large chain [Alloactinosynnema sp. L-07]|uniref:esterase/lipase family protein n=1 Tax=Alloactinosynnema sp. L-07 TaxID=1653480 RepID=UPI00065EFFFF|nr:alpha/beta hydrolase [Alloactinosynnema sp. L-07]CRK59481.1 Glutamate synthase [NADPH] large chain [Alloactinosynnema sp. L-07]